MRLAYKSKGMKKLYFVDMIVEDQIYAISGKDADGVAWTKRKASIRARELNERKFIQLDQPKARFQVREVIQ